MTRTEIVDAVYRVITDGTYPDDGYDSAMALIALHGITADELNAYGDSLWEASRTSVPERD